MLLHQGCDIYYIEITINNKNNDQPPPTITTNKAPKVPPFCEAVSSWVRLPTRMFFHYYVKQYVQQAFNGEMVLLVLIIIVNTGVRCTTTTNTVD